jgi:hypothetical protein
MERPQIRRGDAGEIASSFAAYLNGPERGLARETDGFKPAADIDLGVGFATEMTGAWAQGIGQIPLDDRELLISALDHKPMDRVLTSDPANLALEFFHAGHGFSCEAMARQAIV